MSATTINPDTLRCAWALAHPRPWRPVTTVVFGYALEEHAYGHRFDMAYQHRHRGLSGYHRLDAARTWRGLR